MTYATDLLNSLRGRIRELDLERQRLVDAEQALTGVEEQLAPYGVKADGSPRRKPGRPRKRQAP